MVNKFDIKKLSKVFDDLEIQQGDKLLVNSNTLNLLINNKKSLSPELIIDLLIKKISPEGTLIFPTYNWDFCDLGVFDCNKVNSLMGALSNLSLKRKDFVRSKNPIFSFSIFGKDKVHISNLSHNICFGMDSPFGYLIKNNAKNLFIDLDYKKSLTFVHVAEEVAKVNYRRNKTFSGIYIDKNKIKKNVSYQMYVRDRSRVKSTIIDKKFDLKLMDKNALKKISIENFSFSLVDINVAYNLMLDDLKSKSGLIYPDLF